MANYTGEVNKVSDPSMCPALSTSTVRPENSGIVKTSCDSHLGLHCEKDLEYLPLPHPLRQVFTDNAIQNCQQGQALNGVVLQCAVSSTQKFLVQQHITTSKHQANKQLNSKQRQLFLTQPTTSNVRSEFNIDLCRSLISADIPLYKLKNKVFREFLEKYTQHTIPDESTLRKTYAPSIYDETIQKIRDEIKDSSIWVSIDETPDKEGRLVGNVVIGLLSEQYSERILLHCDVLEKCNNKTIVKLFNEAMGILWPKGIMYDNVLFFISDAAPYMVKAGQALSVVYPKLTHFTCVAHAFHRVAEVVRDNFLNTVEQLNRGRGKVADAVRAKVDTVLSKTLDMKNYKKVVAVMSGESTVKINLDLSPADIVKLNYVPVTSCDVERSFSQYKSILRDNRRRFTFQHLKEMFVTYCYALETAIDAVNGHKTHLTYQLSELCSELKIILIALYPYSRRIIQPADVSAFFPLQCGWKSAVLERRRAHPSQALTKEFFAAILEKLVKTQIRAETLQKVFRACGLYPWDSKAIDYSTCLSDSNKIKANGNDLPSRDTNEQGTSNSVLTYNRFKEIIGQHLLSKFESVERNNKTCTWKNEESNMLFTIWIELVSSHESRTEMLETITSRE
ncbi:hypothetical protein ANN_08797 [Periplaneta americana]|uniref:DUF659 domain-containing protein n=1 Tax=Periplaneta americana TaxID=6978 RepID=A0ABQ8T2E2_PERAM|nr:hypothetical protein ANN_08797 [Periplaneta americana]